MGAKDELAPRVIKKPNLIQDDDDNKLVINCQIEASPKPDIKWFKNNVELNGSNRIKIKTESSDNKYTLIVEINDVSEDDSGVYKATIKNKLGECSASITLNFAGETEAPPPAVNGVAPNFIEKPTIKSDADGKRLCFESKLKADPEPEIHWYRNDVEVIDKGRHLIYCDKLADSMYFACLEIDDVNAEDAGRYRVNAKNKFGESNATITLNFDAEEAQQAPSQAHNKPLFTQKPLIRQLEDRMIFECKLTADPAPTFKWEFQNGELKNSAKYKARIVSEGNQHTLILEIFTLSKKDSGDYKVTAKNQHGEGHANITLNIESTKLDRLPDGQPPTFISKPQIIVDKNKLILQTEIEAKPTPSVNWFFDNKDLFELATQGGRYNIGIARRSLDAYILTLEITDPKSSDAGAYRCVVTNELGECVSNFYLQFVANKPSLGRLDLIAPTLVERPRVIKDDSKKCVRFETRFKAKPEAQITWLKDNVAIKSNSKYKMDVQKEADDVYLYIFEIYDFGANDDGVYKLQAKNDGGQFNILIIFNFQEVQQSPRFTGLPRIIKEDKLIIIECECESQKAPEFAWLHGPKKLKSEGRHFSEIIKVQPNRFKMVLEIDDPQPNDSGLYRCVAKNDNGESVVYIDFLFEDENKDEEPKDKKKPQEKPKDEKKPEEKPKDEKKPEEKPKDDAKKKTSVAEKPKDEPKPEEKPKDDPKKKTSVAEQPKDEPKPEQKPKDEKKPEEKPKDDAKKKTSVAEQPKDEKKPEEKPKDDAKKKTSLGEKPKETPQAPPTFKEKPKDQVVFDGDRVTVTCKVTGEPKPEVTWYRNGQPLKKSKDINVEHNGEVAKLTINDAYGDDTGEYSCEAWNEAGQQKAKFKLTVKEKRGKMKRIRLKPIGDKKDEEPNLEKQNQDDEEKRKREEEEKRKPSIQEPVIVEPVIVEPEPTIQITVPTDVIPTIQVPDEDDDKISPKKKYSMDIVDPVPQLGGTKPSEPIYEEEGPRRAPKQLTGDDASSSGRGARKVSQPSIKLDVIDESGKYKVDKNREDGPSIEDETGSKSSSRRNSQIDVRRQSLRHVDQQDANTLQVRRNSKTRRTSLADLIPDWPTLQPSKKVTKEAEKFNKLLVDQHVKEEDGQVKFSCQFCKSHGKLRWYKNKHEVFHGLKYHFDSQGPNHTLIINKINPDDDGKYICKINDVETSAMLTVEPAKPKFEFLKKLLPKYEVFRTKQTVLECFVNHEACVPKWYRNGVLIKPDDKRYKVSKEQLTNRCTLKILKNTKDDHQAEFTCAIDDKEKTSCTIFVEEPEWRFTKRLPMQSEGVEYRTIELECETEDPDAECEWLFDGKPIDPKDDPDKYEIIVDGLKRKLKIKNLDPKRDPGRYECKCGFVITGTGLFVKEAIKFTKKLTDIEGVEEGSVELSCSINKEDQKPKWFRNGREINPNEQRFDRYFIASNGKDHKLIINNLDLKDAGDFEIQFDFLDGKSKLTVRECEKIPKVDLSALPKHMRVKAGKELQLLVPYESFPIPTAVWKKNGEVLDLKRGLQSNDNKVAALKFDRATRADKGNYEVVLKNIKGEIVIPITVDIIDKPTAPQGPLKVTDVTSQTAVLSWQPPEDDGGAPVIEYIVEKMDVTRGDWSLIDVVSGTQNQLKVTKLTPNKEYLFRVRAVNSEGESPNLETKFPTLAKNPYDQPTAPNSPEITDWNSDRIEVSWKSPDSDGGAEIEKYIIEKREKGKNWQKGAEVPGTSNKATVPNLSEGKEYEFRVFAVNKAGNGQPSDTTRAQIAKPRYVAPKIDKSSIRTVTVKAGQPAHIEVSYIAEPMPVATWHINGKEIKEDDRFTCTLTEKTAKIAIKDTKRSDTGKYVIKMSNSSGSDTAECELVVLAAPSKPSGPIEVKDVKKDSITIAWKKPEDDGGREIDKYIVEKKDKKSDTWDRVNDGILGTSLTVNKLRDGHEYEFRVIAVNPNGSSEPLVTEHPILAKNPFDRPDSPGKPDCKSRSLNHVELNWRPPVDDGGAPITAYIVERKEKSSKKWVKVSKDSQKDLTFIDDKVLPRKEYEYRVIAVNEGGESEPSGSSGLIPAKPEKEKPQFDKEKMDSSLREIKVKAGEPIDIKIPILGSPAPTVTWNKNGAPLEKDKNNAQINNDDTQASLYIPSAKRGDTGNYEVKMENSEGSDSLPIKITVLDKPGKCEGPIELLDSTKSSVTLSWKPPKDDGGADITGFVVEKLAEGTDKWERCSSMLSQPKATIKGLNEGKVYTFRVRAENIYGEGEPLESEPVLVKPPYDPPGAPSQPEVIDSGVDFIRIQWKKPEHDGGNPVTGYVVEIKPKNSSDWTPCNNFPTKTNEYTAGGLVEGQAYELRVKAVNEAGPGSPSKPSKMQKAEPPIFAPSVMDQPKVEGITKESVTLSWKKPLDDGGAKLESYIIEKKTDDKGWEEVLEVPAKENQITIKDVKEDESCQFRIKAKNSAGPGEPSRATDVIKVEDQPQKPSFDLGGVKDITVKAGQNYEIHVPYKAVPKPTAEWTLNEKEILPDNKRILIDVLDNVVTFVNHNAQRSDSGLYKLALRNREGASTTTLKVNVLDHPAKPEGPLDVSNLDAESCTLTWLPPKDNGGNEVSNYIVEKKEIGSDKWTKVSQNCLAERCNVKGLEEGKRYEFRVIAENLYGQSEPLVSSEPVKAKWPFNSPGAPGAPTCTDHSDSSITISWTKPKNDGGNPIAGYVIEKREKGTDKWVPVTYSGDKVPDTEYTVKGLQNGKEYEFRVAAVNKAGPGDWAETEQPIEARPADSAPKAVGFKGDTKEITVKAGEDLKINVPFVGSPAPKIFWTKGGDDLRDDERTVLSLNNAAAQLLVRKATLKDAGPYSCTLKNNVGHDRMNFKVIVVDRPSAPEGPLEVSNVTSDGCVLKWNPPKEEGGAPITNYVIEKFDTRRNDWQKVSSYCRGTTYEVSGLDDGRQYKFRVSAENTHGRSDPLETETTVTAKNPISVPDAPTGLKITDTKPDSVTLEWHPAPSHASAPAGPKAVFYNIEILKPDSGTWETVNDAPIRSNSFKVDDLKPGLNYSFRVRAKNSAGWGEPSRNDVSATLKPEFTKAEAPSAPKPTKIGKKFVELAWEPPTNDGGSKVTGYIVEKKQPGSDAWSRVNSYPVSSNDIVVPDLAENGEYEFRVKAVNKAGESEPSYSSGTIKVTLYPNGVAPEIKKKISDHEAPVGTSVKFEVEFEGNPTPTVKWLRNDIEISPSARYQIVQNEFNSTFTIKELWETDNNSEISCVVVNPLGRDSCSASLKIKLPPKIEGEPGDQVFEQGDTIKVKIPISGKGPFNFKLKKDDQTLEEGPKLKINELDGTVSVVIPDAQRDDTGRYTLQIGNDSGSTPVTFRIKVKAPPGKPVGPLETQMVGKSQCNLQWRPPREDGGSKVTHYVVEKRDCAKEPDSWTVAADNCKDTNFPVKYLIENHVYEFRVFAVNENGASEPLVTENKVEAKLNFVAPDAPGEPQVQEVGNNNVLLSWPKPTSDGGGPIIGYWIEKKEKGGDKWVQCNLTPNPSNSFNVPNLVEDKEYEFRVIAENEAGLSAPAVSKLVKVKDPNAPITPEFTRKLSDNEASEGRTARFECEIKGHPAPSVSWFKGGKEIYDNAKFNISTDGDKYILTINNVGLDDEDEYVVKARNPAGQKSSKANLTVRCAPKIKVPNRFQTKSNHNKGDQIVIKLPYTANPRPNDQWTKDGVPIEPTDSAYRIDLAENYATLTIKNADNSSTGQYGLKLENPLGSDRCSIPIHVLGVPDAPESLKVESVLSESVHLTWDAPLNDGGSPITSYYIERAEVSPTSSVQFWTRSGMTKLPIYIVENLQSDHKYQFRVIAENDQGRSKPSEPTGAVLVSEDGSFRKKHKKQYDANGRRKRGQDGPIPSDYDKCFHDIWATGKPLSAYPKSGSVYDNYDIYEEIGSGAFGVVHRAVEKRTGKTYAAKFVFTPTPEHKAAVQKECDVMNDLIHPRLLNLHDIFDEDDETVLITEFLSGGELFEKCADPNYKMTEEEAKKYIRQLCHGLQHMHENNFVHLDIKPENVVFETKNSDKLKLVDFGLAAKLDPEVPVKISAATIEFAAPEVVDHDSVGFSTDMWAVGVLTYILLSGFSPFAGNDDNETAENVRKCDVKFPSEVFSGISDNGKDFIGKLLVRNKGNRMSVFEALEHPWLLEDVVYDTRIPNSRYDGIRQRIKSRYSQYPDPTLGIGRAAHFSALRKLQPKQYSIYSSYFDRREAAPRFILRPRNQHVLEGQSAEFKCVVIAVSPPLVNWYRESIEIKQSMKYMKRYSRNSYNLEVRKCASTDNGEYVVKASNSYGDRDCSVFLTVEPIQQIIQEETVTRIRRRRVAQEMRFDLWQEADLKPVFTFLLRSRLIQAGNSVKFISCISGKPTPKITWLKGGSPIDESNPRITTSFSHGVCVLEISSCLPEDAGNYTCRGENPLGFDETSCVLVIEEVKYKERKSKSVSVDRSEYRSMTPSVSRNRVPKEPQPENARFLRKIPSFKLHSVGETLTLKCQFSGFPAPKVQWFKNGENLYSNERLILTQNDDEAKLVLKDLKLEDEAEYSCKITNEHGSDTSKCSLELEKPRVSKSSSISISESNTRTVVSKRTDDLVVENFIERLDVAVKEAIHEATESIKEEFFKSESHEESNEKKYVEQVVKDTVQEAIQEAQPLEIRKQSSSQSELVVLESSASSDTEVKTTVTNETTPKAETAEIKTQVVKVQESSSKDDRKDSKSEITIEKTENVVELPDGVRTETVTTIETKSTKGSKFIPKENKLSFNLYTKSQNLVEGNKMVLECSVTGLEPVDVVWLRNNKEIPENPDFLKENTGNLFKLTVNEIFPEDSGVFSAEAFSATLNKTRLSSCSIIVRALDEDELDPKFIEFPSSATIDEGNGVKFTCAVEGTQPITVKWCKNGNELETSNNRFIFNNDQGKGQYTFEIPMCLSTDDGEYHAIASNSKGDVIAAFSLNVEFDEFDPNIDVTQILNKI